MAGNMDQHDLVFRKVLVKIGGRDVAILGQRLLIVAVANNPFARPDVPLLLEMLECGEDRGYIVAVTHGGCADVDLSSQFEGHGQVAVGVDETRQQGGAVQVANRRIGVVFCGVCRGASEDDLAAADRDGFNVAGDRTIHGQDAPISKGLLEVRHDRPFHKSRTPIWHPHTIEQL